MEIFYIKKQIKDRITEQMLGRFVVNFALKNFYKIENGFIKVENKKPFLDGNPLYFSISHTKNIVMAAFSSSPVGLDIEFMRDLDLAKFSKRYNKTFSEKQDFYRFWTKYEADIKLRHEPSTYLTFEFLNDYMITISSVLEFSNTGIYEIGEDLCLRKLEL